MDSKVCVHSSSSVLANEGESYDSNESREWKRALLELFSNLDCAIERGLSSIAVPLRGDIDLLLSERDREKCLERIRTSGMLIYAASAYGGTRLFLGDGLGVVKRVDVMWKLHYRGVPLLEVDRVLAHSAVESSSGLRVLPEKIAMEIACAIKNAYGGAEKYRTSMERHGFSVLRANQRRQWLLALIMKRPVESLYGAVRCAVCYCRRLWRPTGVMIGGVSPSVLNQSALLTYLSQSRSIHQYGMLAGYLRSRLMSEICVVRCARLADVNLPGHADEATCEKEIVNYLRKKRVDVD